MIQIGGVYTTFCQEDSILLQKYAIEMGGVSRYFSKVSGSGVDSMLLNLLMRKGHRPDQNPKPRKTMRGQMRRAGAQPIVVSHFLLTPLAGSARPPLVWPEPTLVSKFSVP